MAFPDGDLTQDGFLGGRLTILQPRLGYRAAMDPVILAAAVSALPGQSVLELGCGAGVASLCLGARVAGLRLCGVEVQPDYADLARRNAAGNGQSFEVWQADIADLPAELRSLTFDHVIANPPYFPPGGGTPSADAGRETALREALPLADWVRIGLARLRPGGWLTLVQHAERLPDLLAALAGRGGLTLLPLAPRAGHPAARVVLRARKGGRSAFVLLPPLVLHEGAAHDGDRVSHTPAIQAVLRDGAALSGFA